MATMAFMVASMAVSAMQTSSQNRALREQQRARDEAARRQVQELSRQQRRADLVAQEEKSDVARLADKRTGELIALAADGGQTVAGLARLAGAVGGIRGLDVARIESNRVEDAMRRRSESISIIEENQAAAAQTASKIRSNTLSFFGNAIGMGLKVGLASGGFTPSADTNTLKSNPSITGPELFYGNTFGTFNQSYGSNYGDR
jgi:hypothetical protein